MSSHMSYMKTLVFVLLSVVAVQSAPVESPFRLRMNADVLKNILHKNDEQLLDLFKNVKLGDHKLEDPFSIKDVVFTVKPKDIPQKDFDFNISFDQETFLGLEGKDLKFVGTGKVQKANEDAESFEFEGPIDVFRLSFQFQDAPENKLGLKGKQIAAKEFEFVVDSSKIKITSTGSNTINHETHGSIVKKWIADEIPIQAKQIKKEVEEGEPKHFIKIPMQTILPMFALNYGSQVAEKVVFTNQFLEYTFSPLSMNLITKRANDKLKVIDSKFDESAGNLENQAFQAIIDENFVNSVFAAFTTIDKMYSLREFMGKEPRLAVLKQLLTTTTLGMVLPTFKEDYGDNKNIDLVGTLSHDFIASTIENLQMSGISLDKNGNLKLNINCGAQIIVEKSHDQWEDARNFFITISAKAKLQVNSTDPNNKTFNIIPRGLELSMFKIYKGDEEMFLEQMLAQSLINVQVDQLRKTLKPISVPLKKFDNPREFQCLGFNLTDLDVKLNKGYIQFGAGYKKIDNPDKELCDAFEKALQEGPIKAFRKMSQEFPAFQSFAQGLGMTGMDEVDESEHEHETHTQIKEDKPKKEAAPVIGTDEL